jgi:hypothetical protein
MIPLLLPNVLIVLILSVSVVFADDFKTLDGKEYKNAQVKDVQFDGIVIETNAGVLKILSKIYFSELPREVQERFHYDPEQMVQKAQSIWIPYIEFRDVTIGEAVQSLVEQEPSDAGINFIGSDYSPTARITLLLQDVTFFQAVTEVAQQFGLSVCGIPAGLSIYRKEECCHVLGANAATFY